MPSKVDYDNYLAKKTASLIRENFGERGVTNLLAVKTGHKWKRTLGHIKPMKNENRYDTNYGSIIEINPLLFDLQVPEYVLDYVIMHELTHYFQGFGSNHTRIHRHPHKGKIVEKELDRLGWKEIQIKSDTWIKGNWTKILTKNQISPFAKPRRRKRLTWKSFFR